ncbi:hypothetical protein E2562_029854 [Oryza meyeriana var. granulata]|uniref:Uncharacterized protein n=1 Tax=Oryza meyeriana var. granulata TaxID=110450 RepID=A0A6G1ER32_9ORYZ|nr:hypothetical protein E2562_029854 [Oryza meyeriana var. granulata]
MALLMAEQRGDAWLVAWPDCLIETKSVSTAKLPPIGTRVVINALRPAMDDANPSFRYIQSSLAHARADPGLPAPAAHSSVL